VSDTISIRHAFVQQFGEANAAAIEAAATSHENDIHGNPGGDPFKWAICICIGYDCITRYAAGHGITADPSEVQAWVIEHGDLASHDGDVDYLAAMAGVYADWMAVES
jgi:hypothetical protein